MSEQYKLRLGDGTVLVVDEDGLRTWALDQKAMVQPPGSHRWRPLKQLLAAPPAPVIARSVPVPAAPAPTAATAAPAPPPTAVAPELPRKPLLTPLAEPAVRVAFKADDGIPIIPFKPLDDDAGRPARTGTSDGETLRDAALAEVEAHGGGDRLWQWSPPGGRPAPPAETPSVRPSAVVPVAAMENE